MSKNTKTGSWGIGELGGVNCRALLVSVGLHILLVAGVAMLYPRYDPSSETSSGVVFAEFVLLDESNGDGGPVQDAEAVADEPEPMAGHAEDALAASLPVDAGDDNELPKASEEIDGSEPLQAYALPQPPELSQSRDRPQPLQPSQPQQPPQQQAATWAHDLPQPAEPSLGDIPLPSMLEAELVASVPAPLPDFSIFREPEIAPLATGEHQMLDDMVAEWSTDTDAVTGEPLSWEHEGRSYSARITRNAADDNMGMDQMVVEVSTERDGRRWSTQMRMQRLAFSSFAQFVDRWDPDVQIHDDEIDGRFHSNSEIFVSRSGGVQPTFHGKVTTARRVITSNSERFVRREEVFLGGLETRVKRIQLPQQFVALDEIDDVPAERVHRFAADAAITFHVDGNFSWAYLKGDMSGHRIRLSDEPHYLLGDKGVSLRVSGVVNGKVLVYAPVDIVIGDDLLYADDPRFNPASDDYVGLIADRNVAIAESRLTGPGDVTVHAAILAKRRFLVRNYRSRGGGTLHVYGSVASGSLSATEPRFRTRLEFDPRLGEARPPGFPVTDRYEVVEWDGTWTEELAGGAG